MTECMWCDADVKFKVQGFRANGVTEQGALLRTCGRHLVRAIEYTVFPGGKVIVERVKSLETV